MNVKKILTNFGVNFVTSHPSVSKNCVGVDCPFCGELKKHVGVFLESEVFSCWKCGKSGHLYKLIREIKDITWKEYCEATGKEDIPEGDDSEAILRTILFGKRNPHEKPRSDDYGALLDALTVKFSHNEAWSFPIVQSFFRKRRFGRGYLNLYGVQFIPSLNELAFPIPPPFSSENSPLSTVPKGYAIRSLQKESSIRWKFTKGIKIQEMLYFNHLHILEPLSKLFIVEGILDAWSINYSQSCAIFGTQLSHARMNKLFMKFSSKMPVYIALDGDAKLKAINIKNNLVQYFDKVHILNLPEKDDPCSLRAKGISLENMI